MLGRLHTLPLLVMAGSGLVARPGADTLNWGRVRAAAVGGALCEVVVVVVVLAVVLCSRVESGMAVARKCTPKGRKGGGNEGGLQAAGYIRQLQLACNPPSTSHGLGGHDVEAPGVPQSRLGCLADWGLMHVIRKRHTWLPMTTTGRKRATIRRAVIKSLRGMGILHHHHHEGISAVRQHTAVWVHAQLLQYFLQIV
eukprot:1154873-Pelagomonas_calceolata.AAC.4